MSEPKPFSKDWWWNQLLEHVYLCKWKYRDLEEMKADSELTDFIIGRIERKIKANGTTSDSEPTLAAFPCWKKGNGGAHGTYHVRRYDTPKTELILWAVKAASREDACNKALTKINANGN